MIEKTVMRSTSLDPSKLTRRVNFDLEDIPDTSRNKLSRNVSIDVPSSTEYYKSKKKYQRKHTHITTTQRTQFIYTLQHMYIYMKAYIYI